MKKTKQQQMEDLFLEMYNELEKTHKFAVEIRSEFILGEATTAEYASYIKYFIKRVSLISKAASRLDVPDTNIYKEDFNFLLKNLNIALDQMKNHAGTATDCNTEITCKSLIKIFKEKFKSILSEQEIEEAITL